MVHISIKRFGNVHIHIVTQSAKSLSPSSLVSRLSEIWRENGHLVTQGPIECLDADIGIVNIDMTRVPVALLPENPYGRPMLNASILDISKRAISSNLLEPDSVYDGKVIIKTNDNYFGLPERSSATSLMGASLNSLLKRLLPWNVTKELWYYKDYPVCESLESVPEWVWERDDLVVERFVPEMEGKEYSLRLWAFFGDQEYGVRMFGTGPIVKAGSRTRFEYIHEVPETLRSTRERLGIDFGKFDYVMVNGEAILLDVNKTPAVSGSGSPGENLLRLASGIKKYISS